MDPTETTTTPTNNASTPVQTDNGNAAEVERLKKEAEQAKMRANQLENQLAEKTKAEEEARRKQLEENEEYKTLYERSEEARKRLEDEGKEATKKATLSSTQSAIFAKFPKEVVEVAETAGLSLSDDSEEAKQQLETKLKTLAEKVGPKRTPTGNNPGQTTEVAPERVVLLDGMRRGNPNATRQIISGMSSIAKMREMAGVEQVRS